MPSALADQITQLAARRYVLRGARESTYCWCMCLDVAHVHTSCMVPLVQQRSHQGMTLPSYAITHQRRTIPRSQSEQLASEKIA